MLKTIFGTALFILISISLIVYTNIENIDEYYSSIYFHLFSFGLVLSILLLIITFYLVDLELKAGKKAEKILKENQAQFQAILDNSLAAIYVKDIDGRYIIANQTCLNLLKRKREEIIGKTIFDLIPKESAEIQNSHDQTVISSAAPLESEESAYFENVRRDFISLKFPLFDSTGKVYAICGMSTEITERKRKEEEIQELNTALANNISELQNLNKEMEAFSYSVSHDLRSPLRAIGGFAQILTEEFNEKLDDDGNRYLKIIINNSQRMGQLIDDLLAFSQLGRKKIVKSEVDMNGIVNSVINELQQTNTLHKCKLEIDNLPSLNADHSMIKQVFTNLLSNAGKFTNIETPEITVGYNSSAEENTYFVKDNGAGFNMMYVDKLFGVFHRLHSDKEFEGTGVGLALVQRIISKHGGKVWAEGEIKKGATFYFTLPKV